MNKLIAAALVIFFGFSFAVQAAEWKAKTFSECKQGEVQSANCVPIDRPLTQAPTMADLQAAWTKVQGKGTRAPQPQLGFGLKDARKLTPVVLAEAKRLGGEARISFLEGDNGWHSGISIVLYIEKGGKYWMRDTWRIEASHL